MPAPEYIIGDHSGGRGVYGRALDKEGIAGAGVHEKPARTMLAAEVYGTDGRRVEMQA